MSDQEKGLCPEATPTGHGRNNCGLEGCDNRGVPYSCRDDSARSYIGCTVWAKHNAKAPAAGVEIINLASQRRTMILAAEDGMDSIVATWTKISQAIRESFDDWLESDDGKAALKQVLTDVLTHPEEGG